jgi:hypothetical protein
MSDVSSRYTEILVRLPTQGDMLQPVCDSRIVGLLSARGMMMGVDALQTHLLTPEGVAPMPFGDYLPDQVDVAVEVEDAMHVAEVKKALDAGSSLVRLTPSATSGIIRSTQEVRSRPGAPDFVDAVLPGPSPMRELVDFPTGVTLLRSAGASNLAVIVEGIDRGGTDTLVGLSRDLSRPYHAGGWSSDVVVQHGSRINHDYNTRAKSQALSLVLSAALQPSLH